MIKLYVNTDIQSIDREITDVFAEYICQAEEESNVALVSRKTVSPDDIERLAQNNRRIILLVDSGDRDLIRAAKQVGIKDLFFSPVKIDSIEKRVNEIIQEMLKKDSSLIIEQVETKQGEENQMQEDSLDELLNCIKARVNGSEEVEALRRENEELKRQLRRYKDFVAVLAEIFKPQKSKGVE